MKFGDGTGYKDVQMGLTRNIGCFEIQNEVVLVKRAYELTRNIGCFEMDYFTSALPTPSY